MGRDITIDYKSEISELFNDVNHTFYETCSENRKQKLYISNITLRTLKRRYPLQEIINKISEENIIKIHSMYFDKNTNYYSFSDYDEDLERRCYKFVPFSIYSKNYFNFSVNGSAFGMKLELKKSEELEEIEKQDQEEYQKIIENIQTPFDVEKKKKTKKSKIENPFGDEDSEEEGKVGKTKKVDIQK